MRALLSSGAVVLVLAACGPDSGTAVVLEFDEALQACPLLPIAPGATPTTAPGPDPVTASLYDPNTVGDLHIELTAEAWDQLIEFKAKKLKHVVPADFAFEGEAFEGAGIRLKGNPDRWRTDRKNQFVIRFDYYEGGGRFRGLRRLNLDAEGIGPIRNQLGMHVMEQAGIPAPRVSWMRLHITVTDSDSPAYPHGLYGLYESIEVIDESFLKARFSHPGGNLYKHGGELKTNGDLGQECDVELLELLLELTAQESPPTRFPERLPLLMDVDWTITHLAAEATLALGDNFWSGSNNYYLYDDPSRGLLPLPWDVDDVLSPVSPSEAHLEDFHGVIRLATLPNPLWQQIQRHPAWLARFESEVGRVQDVVFRDLGAHIAARCAFIRDVVADDPSRRFTMAEFDWNCEELQQRVATRNAFLDGKLGALAP